MRRTYERLLDILEAIQQVELEVSKGRAVFDEDAKSRVWVIHHLQLIGEAVRACSDDLAQMSPETPWAQIVGMRNVLVHSYFGIDFDEVWNTAERDLPALKVTVEGLLAELGGGEIGPDARSD